MKYYLFIVILFVISCTPQQSIEDLELRTDILYEHTILMQDFYTDDEMDMIGLSVEGLGNKEEKTMQQKLVELEIAYNTKVEGNEQKRISHLEDVMVEMMEELIEYENNRN